MTLLEASHNATRTVIANQSPANIADGEIPLRVEFT
jgi:hypothetical protein